MARVLLWALLAWELGACVGLSRLLPSLHSTRAPRCAPRCAAFLASSDDDLYTDDPYKLLQVERGASAEEIRQAFRTRAKGVHPDVSSQPNAAHSFRKLVRAFNRLLDEGGASTGAGASTGGAPSGAREYDGSYDTSVKQRAAERAARAWGASGRSSHDGATPHTHRTRRESEDAEREVWVLFFQSVVIEQLLLLAPHRAHTCHTPSCIIFCPSLVHSSRHAVTPRVCLFFHIRSTRGAFLHPSASSARLFSCLHF